MKNLLNRKVVLPLLMTFNLLSTTIAFPVYANPSWTERLVYSIDNDTFVIGESEWFENKYDAFQSAFLDGLNKINVMRNTEIETTYIEKAYNGKVTSEEFSTIKSSNDFGEIVIKDSFGEEERVSGLHRVFVLLQVLPSEDWFDFTRWFVEIKNLLSFK